MLTKVWYSPRSCLETRRSMLSVNPSKKKNMNTVYFDENKILNSTT